MLKLHGTEKEAYESAVGSLAQARQAGKWMSIVFTFQDDKLEMNRTTSGFPRGSFSEVKRMLDEDLRNELSNILTDEPLPKAVVNPPVDDIRNHFENVCKECGVEGKEEDSST
jgi:hypothetical protein